jgi:DNA-binding ferritin-like protein (Dps family)
MSGKQGYIAPNSAQAVEYVLEGVSKSVLAKMFGMNRNTVITKLKGVAPDGQRGTNPIYKIGNVAARLMGTDDVTKSGEVDVNDPSKMLPDMRKDYWDAIAKEQKAKEIMGELWPTEQVIEMAGNAFKIMKQKVQLFEDTLSQRTEFTEEQRSILNQLTDSLLNETRQTLIDDLQEDDAEI